MFIFLVTIAGYYDPASLLGSLVGIGSFAGATIVSAIKYFVETKEQELDFETKSFNYVYGKIIIYASIFAAISFDIGLIIDVGNLAFSERDIEIYFLLHHIGVNSFFSGYLMPDLFQYLEDHVICE